MKKSTAKALGIYGNIMVECSKKYIESIEKDVPILKQRIPKKDSYSSIELLKYFQDNRIKISTSSQWTNIIEEAEKNDYKELVENMLTGDIEVTSTIVAFPDENGNYTSKIKPRIKNGKHPVMLEEFKIKGDIEDYTLQGGQRTSLSILPKTSGNLEEDIPELGLPKGSYVYINSDFEYGEGLRPVIRGYWYLGYVEREASTNLHWRLFEQGGMLASRPVLDRVDEGIKLKIKKVDAEVLA